MFGYGIGQRASTSAVAIIVLSVSGCGDPSAGTIDLAKSKEAGKINGMVGPGEVAPAPTRSKAKTKPLATPGRGNPLPGR